MKKLCLVAALMASAAALVSPAYADDAADLAAIRKQLNQIDHEYRAKIENLETRLKKAEADAKAARTAAANASKSAVAAQSDAKAAQQQVAQVAAPPAEPPPIDSLPAEAPTPPASANAFNPGIAAVLNGFYSASSRKPDNQRIAGFAIGDDAKLIPNGFSLGESEISFAANIDPEMAGFLDISFDNENHPDVEEAYVRSTDLPWGFTLKAGRFLSGIGYINERHAHDWSFSDAALPYRAFLNTQYGDDGVQLRWLAPTDIFLEFGAEWFRGDEYPAAGAAHGGQGTVTAFVHAGDDINESSSWLAAASYLHTRAAGLETDNPLSPVDDTFTGDTDLGIASLVYKWAPGGNPTVNNFTAVGEFFWDRQKGDFDLLPFRRNNTGWYVQGVYQFMPQWSLGLRYSQLDSGNIPLSLAGSALDDFGHSARASTALLEYDTSEFGRLRLQYTYDQTDLKPNNEILFQYTVIYGPHGAHRY
ncbi:MAG TPA: hypothetical protein VIM56_13425 [Rhizomicrobium sp.]